jgi:hypothetical protein
VEQINAIRNPLSAQSKASSEFVTDANVGDLIKDLFPSIPDDATESVTHHAFQRVTLIGQHRCVLGMLTTSRAPIELEMQTTSHSLVKFNLLS